MTRARSALLVATCVGALATACSGGDGASPPTPTTTSPTTTSPPPTDPAPSSTTTVAPVVPIPSTGASAPSGDEVTLHASGVRLAQPGDAFRVVVHSDAAQVTVTVRSAAARLRVCPVPGLDALAPGQGCVTPASGVATRLPLAPSYTGVEVAGTGGSQAVTVDEVAVSYRPRDRGMEIRLPTMVAGAPPAGTVFQLIPYGTGSYRAQARWTGPAGQQPGDGELVLESGPPPNRRLVAKATGAPGGTVSGSQSTPMEVTLTMRAAAGAPLQTPTLTVTWPS